MKIDPYLLYRDELTNVYNRRYLRDKVPAIFNDLKQKNKRFSILFLDIDKFKYINDTWGHAAGDQALIEFTNILKKSLRKKDILIRYGGDEFVIILPNANLRKATEVAKRIIRNLSNPENWVTRKFMRKTSIGIAVFPKDSEHFESLIEIADTRMYCAKKAGTGFLCYSERFPGNDIYDIQVNLVGREHVFSELISLLENAHNGEFINVLLEGPTETGKHEILNSISEKAASSDFIVINLPSDFTQRFEHRYLIRVMLKKLKSALLELKIPPGENVSDIEHLVKEHDEQAVSDLISDLVCKVSKERPLFLGISNIENIDPWTLKILSLIQRPVHNFPVFVIQTYDAQTISLKESTRSYVEYIKSLPGTKILKIEPFAERETARLLELLLGGPVPQSVVKKIQKVSRGYPKRIKYILDYLHRVGLLKYQDGRWIFENGFEYGIQNWLRDYVKDIFNVLTSRSLEILKALAILEEVEIDYLYELLNVDRLSFYESLSDLSFYGLIKLNNRAISFQQEKISEIIKKDLLKKDTRFQRFIAEKIVELFIREGEGVEKLLTAAKIMIDIGDENDSVFIIDLIMDSGKLVNIEKITELLANFDNTPKVKQWSQKLLKHFTTRGDYEIARELLNKWRQQISSPGSLWINLLADEIENMFKGGKFSDVINIISENYWFIKRNGDHELFLKILFLKGKALEFLGKVKKAKSVYSHITGMSEKFNLESYRLLGLMAFVNLIFESTPELKITRTFSKHIEPSLKDNYSRIKPSDWFTIELARIYANMDNIDGFFSVIKSLKGPMDYFTLASILYLKSEIYLRLGKFEDSLEFVRKSRRMIERIMPIDMVAKHYVIEAVNLFLLDRKDELGKLSVAVTKLPLNKTLTGAVRALNLIKHGEAEKAYSLMQNPVVANPYTGFYYRILNLITFLLIESGMQNISFDNFKILERESNGFTPIEKILLYFNGFAIGIYTGQADKCSDYLNRSVYWIKKILSRASDKHLKSELLFHSPYVKPVFQRIS